MVNIGVFDGPIATAVHGAQDIGDLLETLATMERSIDPTGPQLRVGSCVRRQWMWARSSGLC